MIPNVVRGFDFYKNQTWKYGERTDSSNLGLGTETLPTNMIHPRAKLSESRVSLDSSIHKLTHIINIEYFSN